MFGMGFMEIFLVLIVAIIALGPEKLPSAAIDIAKFFKKFKRGIDEAKSTLDQELNITQMKQEADNLKSSITQIQSNATQFSSTITSDLNDLTALDLDDEKKEDESEKLKQKVAQLKAQKIETEKEDNIKNNNQEIA